MSRRAEIKLPFGGKQRIFRLGIDEWMAIQEEGDVGPPEILQRLAPMVRAIKAGLGFSDMVTANLLGTWRIRDPRMVLYWGLRGGGMNDIEATLLVTTHYDKALSFEHVMTAFLVAEAAWTPPPDDPVRGVAPKSGERKGRRSRPSQTASSATRPSTPPAP